MEKILYFTNTISFTAIQEAFSQENSTHFTVKNRREIVISHHSSDRHGERGTKEYLVYFSKSLSETVLKLRKQYFNIVVIDEQKGKEVHDFQSDQGFLLDQFLSMMEQEPNIDKHYPHSRIMVVLDEDENLNQRIFELGKLHIGSFVTRPFQQGRLFQKIEQIARRKRKTGKKALCLAGGGLEGLLYELGVLRALNSLFSNCQVTDFDIYCGISAGSGLAAFLANGVQPVEFIKAFEHRSEILDPVSSRTIYDINISGYLNAILTFWSSMVNVKHFPPNLISTLIKSFPVSICKGDRLREYVRNQLNKKGLIDDFRKLSKELYIGTTNVDTFQHVVFGDEGWQDVPISTAVGASGALQPLFAPSKIGNSWYFDGGFSRTSNFELAVKKGARLVLIIDPMIPIKTNHAGYVLKKGGLFSAIQGVKGLISSRFDRSYSFIKKQYPDVSFYVFKPSGTDMRYLSGSPMKYKIRLGIVALAYQKTIKMILEKFDIYSKSFRKHGIELTRHVVDQEEKKLISGDINTIKTMLEQSPDYINDRSTSSEGNSETYPFSIFEER